MYFNGDERTEECFDTFDQPVDFMKEYFCSYIYQVSEKRINRYKKKAESECVNFLYEKFPDIKKFNLPFYEILIYLILIKLFDSEKDNYAEDFFKIIHDYYLLDKSLKKNKESLLAIEESLYKDTNILKLADFHFENACKRFIARRSYSKDYNESNFMQCLPIEEEDCLSLIEDCLNGFWVDASHYLKGIISVEDDTNHPFRDQISSLENQIKKLEKDNSVLLKKNNEYCMQIQFLKKDIEQIRNYSDNKYEKIISELKRENENYKKKLKTFTKKESISSEEPLPEEKILEKPIPAAMELDTSLNYIFITDPEYRSSKRIEQTFPNSLITKETISYAQTKNVTAVIFLTKNLKHSDYYKSKDFCIDHDIPYIHCVPVNVDSIKEKMLHDLKDIVAVKKGGC